MSAPDDNRPFPIVLDLEFLDRISEPVREGRAPSLSALIREALDRFDFNQLVVVHPAQVTISVRLPAKLRLRLRRLARMRRTSVGQLVRAAVDAHLPRLAPAEPEEFGLPIPHVELPESAAIEEAASPADPVRPPGARGTRKKAGAGRKPPVPPRSRKKSAPTGSAPAKSRSKAVGAPSRGMTRKRRQG